MSLNLPTNTKKTVSKAKYLRFPALAHSATVKLNKSLTHGTRSFDSTALALMPHVLQHVHVHSRENYNSAARNQCIMVWLQCTWTWSYILN